MLSDELVPDGGVEDPLEVARALDAAGGALNAQGRVDEAASLFERALAIYEKLGAKRQVARVLNDLAGSYIATRNYRKALLLLERSLESVSPYESEWVDALRICQDLFGRHGGLLSLKVKTSQGASKYKISLAGTFSQKVGYYWRRLTQRAYEKEDS